MQIKTPDLGGINNTIEAVLYCKAHGMGAGLGGTANETDQSARISTQIGLACRPDFHAVEAGPRRRRGVMIQTNEMARTLAILKARGSRRGLMARSRSDDMLHPKRSLPAALAHGGSRRCRRSPPGIRSRRGDAASGRNRDRGARRRSRRAQSRCQRRRARHLHRLHPV